MATTHKPIRSYLTLAALLALVAWADWSTGADFSVSPLYFFTVVYGAWNLGKLGGTVASLVSVSSWALLDHNSGHLYAHPWIIWEQIGVRLITYMAVTFGVALYRKTLEAHRQRLAMLEQVLAVCPGCGRIGPQEAGWQRAEDLNSRNHDRYKLCPVCISTQKPDAPAHPTLAQHP